MEFTLSESEILSHAGSISVELLTAAQSALAAGEVVKAGAHKLEHGTGQKVEQKGVGDLVSQVDRDADLAATQVIRSASQLPILSEELNCSLEERDNLWIVDPLDASSAYLMQAGVEYPSVLVALRRDGITQVGVAYFPLSEEWFYAERGRGAWKDGKRLVCDGSESLAEVWVEMNQYGDSGAETKYFRDLGARLRSSEGARLVTSYVPYSGVAMRIAECKTPLAAAVHDNNPESIKQAPWDIAAPQVILEEAGGVFLDQHGQPADPFTAAPTIVARSREIAEAILALGQPAFTQGQRVSI